MAEAWGLLEDDLMIIGDVPISLTDPSQCAFATGKRQGMELLLVNAA
jgi:hypothetical protein